MDLLRKLIQALLFIILFSFFQYFPILDSLFPTDLLGSILKTGTIFIIAVAGSYMIKFFVKPPEE